MTQEAIVKRGQQISRLKRTNHGGVKTTHQLSVHGCGEFSVQFFAEGKLVGDYNLPRLRQCVRCMSAQTESTFCETCAQEVAAVRKTVTTEVQA